VSPNNSATLSSFASGGWYVDTAGFFLQGDVGTKVKTPSAGKNIVGELCKLLLWRGCASSIFPTQELMTGLQQSAIWSSNPTPRVYPKECNSGYFIHTCTPMFIAALFTIAKLWKQPRSSTANKCIKKMWYLYITEFYSATKKNEILSFASKWMELKQS
jgi:hypothetical protein